LNPIDDPASYPELDPADAYLVMEHGGPATHTSLNGLASSSSLPGTGASTPVSNPAVSVPWLRRTEYITGERSSAAKATVLEQPRNQLPPVDISHAAQIATIESSFAACNENFDLHSISHPTKKRVKAVDSYEILPDSEIWENAYDLFRFSEKPGERPPETEDPRLDCAILRPMESEGDHFLAYYLTETDDPAVEFKERRASTQPYEVQDHEWETTFHFVRDYETVKIEREVPNEFLLVIDQGEEPETRSKGAYYKNIERKMILKKRRVNQHEEYQDKWEIVRLTHAVVSPEEKEERDEARAEVLDPSYTEKLMSGRGDADADAEGELDHEASLLEV
jgi:RNA polymerase II-associated factor 1